MSLVKSRLKLFSSMNSDTQEDQDASGRGSIQAVDPPESKNETKLDSETISVSQGLELGGIKHRMFIKIISANGLKNSGYFGKSDPYAKITLPPYDKRSTAYVVNQLNPTWNEGFAYGAWSPQDTLKIAVWDHDIITKDDFLGEVTVSYPKFPESGVLRYSLPLQPASQGNKKGKKKHKKKKNDISGSITFEIIDLTVADAVHVDSLLVGVTIHSDVHGMISEDDQVWQGLEAVHKHTKLMFVKAKQAIAKFQPITTDQIPLPQDKEVNMACVKLQLHNLLVPKYDCDAGTMSALDQTKTKALHRLFEFEDDLNNTWKSNEEGKACITRVCGAFLPKPNQVWEETTTNLALTRLCFQGIGAQRLEANHGEATARKVCASKIRAQLASYEHVGDARALEVIQQLVEQEHKRRQGSAVRWQLANSLNSVKERVMTDLEGLASKIKGSIQRGAAAAAATSASVSTTAAQQQQQQPDSKENVGGEGEGEGYVVRCDFMSQYATRPGLARYGGNCYFDKAGNPTHIKLYGKDHYPDSEGWEYAKFVFRSSLLTLVTLWDHIFDCHFMTANVVTHATRAELDGMHPVRRLLAPFQYRTVLINYRGVTSLLGKQGLFERATAFTETSLAEFLEAGIDNFTMDSFQKRLDTNGVDMEDMPEGLFLYGEDGLRYWNTVLKFARSYLALYYPATGTEADKSVQANASLQTWWSKLQELFVGSFSLPNLTSFEQLVDFCAHFIFSVTALHEHVGSVAEYLSDPDFVAGKWPKDRAMGSVNNSFQLAVIAILTGLKMPMLLGDFSHMMLDDAAKDVYGVFKTDLEELVKTIDELNSSRSQPFNSFNPRVLEISVSI